VVDATGDNLLAEFSSVVDAVNCAVEIQRELAERNVRLHTERRMEFRIGVNLGDVVEEGERIYGDGVNIAARIEGLAEGGGICISGIVYDQVKHKLGLEYEYLGEQEVKNIREPVRVYRVLSFPGAAAHRVIQARKTLERKWRKTALALAVALVLVVASAVLWSLYVRSTLSPLGGAPVEKMAYPLPENPSIAVLPFINMSGDPGQEYLSDGLTEELITSLSKIPDLFVIARNSTFTYKGKSVKVQQVGQDLGVRYVLEGSVRKIGDRIRIMTQLIDSATGRHLWAERYDRDLKDIFALQDEITLKILTALQIRLTEGEQARMLAKGTDNLAAYLKFLQGREYVYRLDKDANVLGRQICEELIALEPGFAGPYVVLALSHIIDAWYGSSRSPAETLTKAMELAQKAVGLDDSLAAAHGILSFVFTMKREHQKAIAEGERAVVLNPNGADAYVYLAMALTFGGRPEEAIPLFEKAIRLNPIPPIGYFLQLAIAYRETHQFEDSIAAYKKVLHRSPNNLFAHIGLAGTYSLLGHEKEARAAAKEVLRINPKFSLEYFAETLPYKNKVDKEFLIDALRKAGLK
jgi:adenylate cyclase